MSREIKFRGYTKHPDSWVYGSLIKSRFPFQTDSDAIYHIADEQVRVSAVSPGSVGQFTGLCMPGENGKEVYEGDIFRYGEHYALSCSDYQDPAGIAVVEFSEGRFCLRDPKGEWGDLWGCIFNWGGIIIGNIFEHGDLLK